MNKHKKISIILLMISIIIGMFYTTSQAYSVGQRLDVSIYDYWNDPDIYCAEHGQMLLSNQSYKIISEIKIEGNESTDHKGKKITHPDNAKFATILQGDNGPIKAEGPVANGIWNLLPDWMLHVGQHHAGLYLGFTNGVRGDITTDLDKEANEYAENLKNMEMTDNTNKEKIKATSYEKDGKSYIRVGPFNWSFPGTINEVQVYNQDNKPIKGVLYSSFKGKDEIWYKVNKLKNKKDFYISFPADQGVSKITKITAKTKVDINAAKVWFLESISGSSFQNLLIREPYKAEKDLTTDFEYNINILGDLKVVKVNKDNHKIPLKGVGFIIKNKDMNKYVKSDENKNITYVDKKEDATEFITDDKGEFSVENLIVGTYIAYETKNPNYGYEIIKDGVEQTVEVDKTKDFVIENKQIYVKLSGYVWEDKIFGKQALRNDLFKDNDYDSEDILIPEITVRLKDKSGNVVKEAKTDENGAYLFKDVLIEQLENYYIEFEYDGITYTNVVPHIDKDNGSKAAENPKTREEFNNGFSTILGNGDNTGYTLDGNGNKKHDLSYEKNTEKHTSTFINNGQFPITANTNETQYIIREHFEYGQEEVKYINLGLYRREQPDLALIKDLDNVKLTINGYEHIYEYAQRFKNQGEYGDGFNVGVKFANKYGEMKYTRPIYKADYEYVNEKDKSKELKAFITYKIAVRNESTNLTSQVNSLVDYFDSKYKILAIGTGKDEETSNISGNIDFKTSDYNNEYSKVIINTNTKIEAQKNYEIYVQFELSREAIVNIMNDGENLENVVEINSYSTFGEDGKAYAGIDVDSNPGNAKPEDKTTYEDDTDSSPSLKLEVADARELAGTVFLDETNMPELQTNKERKGNGKYDEGEKGIANVEVTLTENTEGGKVYTAKTDENGNFTITGFIPGDYTLTYTWGDETYTVQNYKGTIYDKSRDVNNKEWYKQDVDTRLTDAIDNYNKDQEAPKGSRLQIDEEMKILEKGEKKYSRTKMDSTTPTMGLGIEYDNTTTASSGDKYVYRISNIDFGIVERPRQQIELKKRVKTMKVTLANGQVIVDLQIDEEGNITGLKDGIIYMGPSDKSNPKNGFIKLEMDNELIEGSKLEVTYEIKAVNTSELDYATEEYYKYGVAGGEVLTIIPSAVIDYLDKDWGYNPELNSGWEVKTVEELKNLVAEVVYNNEESSIDEKTILYTENLKTPLKPTETKDTTLNVSKILTTAGDILLNNETEIIKIEKPNGGRDVPSTPGNFIPGEEPKEPDESTSETVIITPNTGANRNFIIPISVGLVALVVLGTGVIFIKKKILNK